MTIYDLQPVTAIANDVELVTLTVDEKEVAFIDSRNVAEMMETRHSDLLAKIDGINGDFTERKIPLSKYWMESSYKDVSGKSNRNYLITKRGCEFLAHKTTGTKGNLFTDRYMDVFEKMEQTIKNKQDEFYNNLSTEMKSILLLDTRTQELDKKISNVAKDFNYFVENETLSSVMCDELSKKVRRVGTRLLGGHDSVAYNVERGHYRRVLFRDIYNQLKREFGIDINTSYKVLKRKQFEDAMDYLDCYRLPGTLKSDIENLNSQIGMEM